MKNSKPRWLYPVPGGNDPGYPLDVEELLDDIEITANLWMPLVAIEPDEKLPIYSVKAIHVLRDEECNAIENNEIAWASVVIFDPFDDEIDFLDSCDAHSGDLMDFYTTIYDIDEGGFNEPLERLAAGRACLIDEFIMRDDAWIGGAFIEWIIKYVARDVDAVFILPVPSYKVKKEGMTEIHRIKEPAAEARFRQFFTACGFFPFGESEYMYKAISEL